MEGRNTKQWIWTIQDRNQVGHSGFPWQAIRPALRAWRLSRTPERHGVERKGCTGAHGPRSSLRVVGEEGRRKVAILIRKQPHHLSCPSEVIPVLARSDLTSWSSCNLQSDKARWQPLCSSHGPNSWAPRTRWCSPDVSIRSPAPSPSPQDMHSSPLKRPHGSGPRAASHCDARRRSWRRDRRCSSPSWAHRYIYICEVSFCTVLY